MNIKAILAVMNTTSVAVVVVVVVVIIRSEKKNSGLYGIWTHDLSDTGVALYSPHRPEFFQALFLLLLKFCS